MKIYLYLKLALIGIKKNRRMYIPYILTCIGMVMMFYIMQSLSYSTLLNNMRGGSSVEMVLSLGKFVIAVFALIFLIYTNSFLIRGRNREFGLYNILGMDKNGICCVIAWETLTVSLIGLGGGIALGIAFSKFAELGLLNALKTEIDYSFTLSLEAVRFTILIFGVIFFLLFLKCLWQIKRSKPMELIKSRNVGEKPPKANWLLAVLGVVILGTAYYLAVSIKSPISALVLFFAAVIMVIIATYMLFTAGSVALCRLLKNNKGYYYKSKHFVSVSSMAYRMKRNGSGLASICILSTMVLVMLSSTSSLYIGAEDSIRTMYPRDNSIAVYLNAARDFEESNLSELRTEYESVFDDYNVKPHNVAEYGYGTITGLIVDRKIEPDSDAVNLDVKMYDSLRQVIFISAKDYNRTMGTDISLNRGQAVIYTVNCDYNKDTLSIGDVDLDIVGSTDSFPDSFDEGSYIVPSIMLVIYDYKDLTPLERLEDNKGNKMLIFKWYYGYDLELSDEEKIQIFNEQRRAIGNTFVNSGNGYNRYSSDCSASGRRDFYTTYGGLFFLGIMLSIVFIFAAVLIIYYKQMSEGYEDQSAFEVMQKVGMTTDDIRRSVNSQVLTVFFAPLIFAGLHLGFAFPMIWKILQMFNLHNLSLAILTNIGAFLLFALFYAAVYKTTAKAYYSIVSNAKRR